MFHHYSFFIVNLFVKIQRQRELPKAVPTASEQWRRQYWKYCRGSQNRPRHKVPMSFLEWDLMNHSTFDILSGWIALCISFTYKAILLKRPTVSMKLRYISMWYYLTPPWLLLYSNDSFSFPKVFLMSFTNPFPSLCKLRESLYFIFYSSICYFLRSSLAFHLIQERKSCKRLSMMRMPNIEENTMSTHKKYILL